MTVFYYNTAAMILLKKERGYCLSTAYKTIGLQTSAVEDKPTVLHRLFIIIMKVRRLCEKLRCVVCFYYDNNERKFNLFNFGFYWDGTVILSVSLHFEVIKHMCRAAVFSKLHYHICARQQEGFVKVWAPNRSSVQTFDFILTWNVPWQKQRSRR